MPKGPHGSVGRGSETGRRGASLRLAAQMRGRHAITVLGKHATCYGHFALGAVNGMILGMTIGPLFGAATDPTGNGRKAPHLPVTQHQSAALVVEAKPVNANAGPTFIRRTAHAPLGSFPQGFAALCPLPARAARPSSCRHAAATPSHLRFAGVPVSLRGISP